MHLNNYYAESRRDEASLIFMNKGNFDQNEILPGFACQNDISVLIILIHQVDHAARQAPAGQDGVIDEFFLLA